MGEDSLFLGEALRVVEGLLVGDASRQLPDPNLGITLSLGLFLGRPLREAPFLTDKEVAVFRTRTVNSDQSRNTEDANVKDAVTVEISFGLPADSVTLDQRTARDAAYVLVTQMRGAIMQADFLQPRGIDLYFIDETERGALNSHPDGAGSYEFLVISSTYQIRRIESLTGGAAQ